MSGPSMSGPSRSGREDRRSGDLLLGVSELRTWFESREGTVRAVDGVSFDLHRGETLGIAGESGCGKSVTAQSILRIVPRNGRIVSGSIVLHRPGGSVELTGLAADGSEIRAIRGAEISLIFQEPMAAFSPVYTIGNQVIEVIRLHQRCSARAARQRAVDMLQQVGMPRPEQTIDAYPWAVSGGMRQRAMIAMALACRPSLLIADEPTTAVDVTIQAQVLELMKALQEQLQMGLIIITHDLAVIAELCDRVMVMYLGTAGVPGADGDVSRSGRGVGGGTAGVPGAEASLYGGAAELLMCPCWAKGTTSGSRRSAAACRRRCPCRRDARFIPDARTPGRGCATGSIRRLATSSRGTW